MKPTLFFPWLERFLNFKPAGRKAIFVLKHPVEVRDVFETACITDLRDIVISGFQ